MVQSILVIGGAGAQGQAVVQILSESGLYHSKVLTRNSHSPEALSLAELPNVTVIEGENDEPTLLLAMKDVDACFVNTNGFAIGEKNEIYWGIRMFELARLSGVKHFIYSSLDYLGPKTNYEKKFECMHYLGKARVAEFMKSQPTTPTNWSVITTGPYMEGLSDYFAPKLDESGTYVFTRPLGENGHMPLIVLSDIGKYVLWILTNPSKSSALNLAVATEHVSGSDLASSFTKITGKPARYEAVEIDQFLQGWYGHLPKGPDTTLNDYETWTFRENFSAWWEIYRHTGGDGTGVIERDYAFLDRVLPERIRSVEEWMERVGYTGEKGPALLKNPAHKK